MIRIKNQDLLNGIEILQKLSQTHLKARPSWEVSRILKATDVEIQNFNEARMNLIRRYGEKDENGELITDSNDQCKIIPEEINNFAEEFNELVNAEVEINANKVRIDDIADKEFTPAEMSQLEPFIDFE